MDEDGHCYLWKVKHLSQRRGEDDLERVELYFTANDVAEDKKVPILLSVIGANTYAFLRSQLTPTAPKDKSFADITKELESHFESKPNRAAERYHFRRRRQACDESIADYVAELRRLTTHCKFNGYLEDDLCDQLVCGLRVESIRKKLLSEDDLTFAKALKGMRSS